MSQLLLIVPGLLWPAPQTHRPAQDLPLAALSRLLGYGQRRIEALDSPECLLMRLFGVDDKTPPLAALRRLGENTESTENTENTGSDGKSRPPSPSALASRAGSGTHWLCADPVHLSLTREYLLLGDFADEEIAADEAAALSAALNRDFSDLGQFIAATPTRWYLRLEHPPTARFSTLHDATGRPIQDFLPEGDESDADADAIRWRRILNEIQIALHNHPANKARETAGQRTINSLWFWGASARPAPDATPRPPCQSIQTLDPITRGLARAANIEPGPPDLDTALRADTLLTLDTLAAPARRLDLAAWRTALAALENDYFAPIAKALDTGVLHRLELLAPSDRHNLSLTLNRRSPWRFWRKPLPLDELHAANASRRPAKSRPERPTQGFNPRP
ncbi:MAG: hypothetical protein LBI68_02495 [Azoarcus sp.]|jgi:hypothetical protein|nr:hypothetical protein [Azoarcus sp.]